jgi:hypothetical protein
MFDDMEECPQCGMPDVFCDCAEEEEEQREWEKMKKELGIEEKIPACGNPKCGCSTGIHQGLTFGSGELDALGFWQYPCPICAREWDKRQAAECEDFRQNLIRSNPEKSIEEIDACMRRDYEWLLIPGWPFPDSRNQ